MRLTCPRKGTSNVSLREPTCLSGFESHGRTAFAGYLNIGEIRLIKRMLVGLIRSYAQSDDFAMDPEMKTRYYKMSRDKVMEEIKLALEKSPGLEFCFEINNAGELIYLKKTITGRIQDITITVTKTGPIQTAVDIYSASRGSFGDLGSNYRVIRTIYRLLDARLPK
jgi:hypothetical protein